MKDWLSIKLGRAVQKISSLYGGGSALPGLILEKINPDLVAESLQALPHGVLVVSGTNGKTTTTKIIVKILEDQGLKVFTNKTGSNFMRGVASAWLENLNCQGELEADIAVLELDEAHAVHFTEQILPRYCLLLNIMRDQLDRFGELNKVAELLEQVAQKTTRQVILNAADDHLRQLGQKLNQEQVCYFGFNARLKKFLTNNPDAADQLSITSEETAKLSHKQILVTLDKLTDEQVVFKLGDQTITSKPVLDGFYNQLNIAAAICAAKTVLKQKLNLKKLLVSLSELSPAFGRGETFFINQRQVKLILVKNPAGFQAALSVLQPATPVLIAINDNYADGRDISWLWDVNFRPLQISDVATSGSRSADMALRLKYDEITAVHEPQIRPSLRQFLLKNSAKDVIVFATYTAMLKMRYELTRLEKKHD